VIVIFISLNQKKPYLPLFKISYNERAKGTGREKKKPQRAKVVKIHPLGGGQKKTLTGRLREDSPTH